MSESVTESFEPTPDAALSQARDNAPDAEVSTASGSVAADESGQVDTAVDDETPVRMADVRKLRHEAAGLRIQLKEAKAAQAQLEGAAARLAALEHAEVERIAAEQLIDAEDVWRISPDVQQGWYDQQFAQLQPDKVREAIEALVQAKPHLARAATPPPTQRTIEGLRPGASPEPKHTEVTWSSALHRR